MAVAVLPVLLVLFASRSAQAQYRPYFGDLPGPYCANLPNTRPRNCCPDRYDECSVPILDTRCYCDEFCDRGVSGDCCPDYFSYCLGEQPEPVQRGCTVNGRPYPPGSTIKENCNICTCMASPVDPNRYEMMCDTSKCLIQPDLIDDINVGYNYGWTAGNYSQFWGRKLSQGLQLLLGTQYPNDMINAMYPVVKIYDPASLPRSFDVRDKREWRGLIAPVVDQGWCGASWAVSTVTTASDRLAIQSLGAEREPLSVQNVLDCGYTRENGCLGGALDRAWSYLRRYGVTVDQCYPYTSGQTGTSGRCQIPRRSRQPARLTCLNGTTVTLQSDQLIGMQPPYRIASNQFDIMHELYNFGPVQALLRVHEDFFVYRSGVYRSTRLRQSARTAYHSVRILGWGEEIGRRGETLNYWLVANSWGEQWGERGLFRILRGENEADIETFVVGAGARPSREDFTRNAGYRNYRRYRRRQRHLAKQRLRNKRHHHRKNKNNKKQ